MTWNLYLLVSTFSFHKMCCIKIIEVFPTQEMEHADECWTRTKLQFTGFLLTLSGDLLSLNGCIHVSQWDHVLLNPLYFYISEFNLLLFSLKFNCPTTLTFLKLIYWLSDIKKNTLLYFHVENLNPIGYLHYIRDALVTFLF